MEMQAVRVGSRVEVVVRGTTPFRGGEGQIGAYDNPADAVRDAEAFLAEARAARVAADLGLPTLTAEQAAAEARRYRQEKGEPA